jgi:hypothetical protein
LACLHLGLSPHLWHGNQWTSAGPTSSVDITRAPGLHVES